MDEPHQGLVRDYGFFSAGGPVENPGRRDMGKIKFAVGFTEYDWVWLFCNDLLSNIM